MEGWIKLHRRILDWEWYDDANAFRLFIHCLLSANHKDKKWRGIEIKAGQFITSYPKLSRQLKLSEQQVRRLFKKIASETEVKSTHKYTLVTVTNWEVYQLDEKKSEDKPKDKRRSSGGVADTNKNEKNDKNDKNIKTIVEYLNEKSNSKYKHTSKATQSKINARLKEGFELNDFKKVIDIKCAEWIGTEYEKYLRPETIFGTKFESYLNQKEAKPVSKKNGFHNFKSDDSMNGMSGKEFEKYLKELNGLK